MAMASENVVVSDKSRFSGGGEMIYQRQWFPDERDGFIMWLRGEFAAANAMIDSLCQHLTVIGEPGEYDGVVASIQDRRCNWSPVLHMQHFFSISEVLSALQQVGWRRQQRRGPGKEFRKSGGGFRQGQRGEFVNGGRIIENVEKVVENGLEGERVVENEVVTPDDLGVAVLEDKRDMAENLQECSSIKISGSLQGMISNKSEPELKPRDDSEGRCNAQLGNDLHSSVKQNSKITPKTFVANEILDGRTVNVVDGMKLYDELLNTSEVTKIIPLVNDMRAAGKRGELQGRTFIWSKKPMKGRGREVIQLGLPIANTLLEGENAIGAFTDQNTLPIPQLLQDVIDSLVSTQVLTVKPDSCIIDVFNEGDYSQPHMWPTWYGRPVSVLFLTECEMTFGKLIGAEYPGDYNGSFRLSLRPGSLLVMRGNSADLAKYAMSSFKKQRILITLAKLQPRKTAPSAVAPIPQWGPLPSRSLNHGRHPMPKHYGPIVTNGVMPAPPVHPQLGPPNGMQPVFMSPPIAPAMPFPAPVALPPRPPPRLPVPGTGVFLPPGSNNSSSPSTMLTDTSVSAEPDKENGLANPNESNLSNHVSHKECNGGLNGATGGERFGTNEGQQQDVESQEGNQASGDN